MVELKFFRDEKNVYFNNPNGVTIKRPIEDFEKWISGEGGGGGGEAETFHVKIEAEPPTDTAQPVFNIISRSHSVSEIVQAIDDKKIVVITISVANLGAFQLSQVIPYVGEYIFNYISVEPSHPTTLDITQFRYRIDKGNLLDYIEGFSFYNIKHGD